MSMKMRSIAAEKGIVKVVHPGRYVEVLKDPITAGEVMMKNPRHRVTRPDIFKFPWIVIKPESVLPPGKVFYLVPERTLYDLMKSEMNRNPRIYPPEPSRDFAGMTPKHRNHGQTSSRTEQRPRKKDRDGASSSYQRRPGDGGRGGAEVGPLKSCLTKSESDRKLRGLRVRFELPWRSSAYINERQSRSENASFVRFADFLNL